MNDLEQLWQTPALNTDCVSMFQVIGGQAHLVYYAAVPNTQMATVANALGLRRGHLVVNPPRVTIQLVHGEASLRAAGYTVWRSRPVDQEWISVATQHGHVVLTLCEETIPADAHTPMPEASKMWLAHVALQRGG